MIYFVCRSMLMHEHRKQEMPHPIFMKKHENKNSELVANVQVILFYCPLRFEEVSYLRRSFRILVSTVDVQWASWQMPLFLKPCFDQLRLVRLPIIQYRIYFAIKYWERKGQDIYFLCNFRRSFIWNAFKVGVTWDVVSFEKFTFAPLFLPEIKESSKKINCLFFWDQTNTIWQVLKRSPSRNHQTSKRNTSRKDCCYCFKSSAWRKINEFLIPLHQPAFIF